MAKRVLITGGAGFIGSHTADELLRHGYKVRALDILSEQVHGPNARRPAYLHDGVELCIGDVRDEKAVTSALEDVDIVYHFAATAGTGRSIHGLSHYTSVNLGGTSVLLEALTRRSPRSKVERLIVASSLSVYGEGLYRDPAGKISEAQPRSARQIAEGDWTVRNADGDVLEPLPTSETKSPSFTSIEALTKHAQEKMCLMAGNALGIPTVALRFFNVYGTRQAVSSPYAGCLATFASRYLSDTPPVIFEDGFQRRDFVSVLDAARASRLAAERSGAAGRAINIGSGKAHTVREIARFVGDALAKSHLEPRITGTYRVGDVRHCFSDISLARAILGYQPKIDIETGVAELSRWLRDQAAHKERPSQEAA